MRTPILAVRLKLLLGWNTYLLFNSDIVNFVWKTKEGETESTVLLIFVLWRCFNRRWMRGDGVGQKVLFRSSWNCMFFQLWLVSTKYFYVLFLWAIAVSDFLSLKIYENVGLLLSTATFTVNSHIDNNSYKFIYLVQIL